MARRRIPLEERFWKKVRKTNDCWEWTGCTDQKGYGRIAIKQHNSPGRAPRIAWELHFGLIPAGLHVLHKCDNPKCVRPDHLFLGTNDDNMNDKRTKGRQLAGIQTSWAKLTEADVIAIRTRYAAGGISQRTLATQYNLHQVTISEIILRKIWRHLT